MMGLYPLRRSLDRPWGNIILRVGSTGYDEDFLDRPTPKQIDKPQDNYVDYKNSADPLELSEQLHLRRDGELFFYLNRPELAVPGYGSAVANWVTNSGWAEVVITSSNETEKENPPKQ